MNLWTKFGCLLTGWNFNLLSGSSEASKSKLSKYASALLILILIWGVTGFCFAQRYIELPIWACACVSLFFITIVIMVERQIILTTEKKFSILIFRILIAVVMAVVGSTIFDQTMFGKDISMQMTTTIDERVKEISAQRVQTIDEKLAALKAERDSLENTNSILQEDVNLHPTIKQASTSQVPVQVQNADGSTKIVMKTAVSTAEVPNPKIKTIEENNKKVKYLYSEESQLTNKKLNVEKETRDELMNNVGFLEELEAMWTIISTRPIAGVFYGVFFFLLMSLELFVVVSKMADKECGYEVAVKTADLNMLKIIQAKSNL